MTSSPSHSSMPDDAGGGVMAMIDSGVGGLSVLLAVKKQRPDVIINYLADTKNAPFGDQPHDFIIARGEELTTWLCDKNPLATAPSVMVVACNTITVHSIANLRASKQAMNFVGVEPGLKPAIAMTDNKRVALLATRATLESAMMKEKIKNYEKEVAIFPIAGVGLVDAIEQFGTQSKEVEILLQGYLDLVANTKSDVLALGCTHYSFLQPMIKKLLPSVTVIDTAMAVATRAISFLPAHDDAREDTQDNSNDNAHDDACVTRDNAQDISDNSNDNAHDNSDNSNHDDKKIATINIFTTGEVAAMKDFIATLPDFPATHVEKIKL